MRKAACRLIAVCLTALLVCGCAWGLSAERVDAVYSGETAVAAEHAEVPEPREVEPTCRLSVAPEVGVSILSGMGEAYDACFGAWFRSYVESRKVEQYYEEREAMAFGPWEAAADHFATDAAADGSLTEWNDDYYVTHDWSQIGQCILSFVPGDEVQVNGRSVTIQGILNYPKDGYYDEVMAIVGEGAVVFQTCYPDSDYNRIAYGR